MRKVFSATLRAVRYAERLGKAGPETSIIGPEVTKPGAGTDEEPVYYLV